MFSQDGGIECDWCGQWEHAECAEDELKVLYIINSCIKFFCKACQPKVEVAFTFFDDIQEKLNCYKGECNLSKSVADLNSRLEQLNKQLNDHPTATQSIPSQSKGAPTLTETAQTNINSQLPANKHVVMSDNSADHKFNVVVYGIKENPSGTPRSARTKSDIDCCVHIFTEHSIRDCLRLGNFNSTRAKPRPILVKLQYLMLLT